MLLYYLKPYKTAIKNAFCTLVNTLLTFFHCLVHLHFTLKNIQKHTKEDSFSFPAC